MMKGRHLMAELADAFERLSEAQRAWLMAQGVDKVGWARAGGLGCLPVVAWADGTFEPARPVAIDGGEGGVAGSVGLAGGDPQAGDACTFNAVILGVFGRPVDDGVVVGADEPAAEAYDAVAFDPRDPAKWWRRTRTAFALGEWALSVGGLGIDPDAGPEIRLCATPLSWLREVSMAPWPNDATGPVCILGPVAGLTPAVEGEDTRYLRDVLAGAARVVCDDAEHARQVHAALRRLPKATLPEVFVAAGAPSTEAAA